MNYIPNYQWKLKDCDRHFEITAFVRNSNCNVPIATVEDGYQRSVRQMLRYAQLGEDCEHIADKLLAGSITAEEAGNECLALARKAIGDVMSRSKVPCPEVIS